MHTSVWDADLAGRIVGKYTGTPVIAGLVSTQYSAEATNEASDPWKLELARRLDRVLARRATFRFHALTQAAAEEGARALGIDPLRITVVPRGRDRAVLGEPSTERRTTARQDLGLDDKVVLIVNVARQQKPKGIPLLVEAFSLLAERHPTAILLQAGRPGVSSDQVEHLIRRHGLQDRFLTLGRREDVPTLLAAADAFAFSSLWEGQGGAVLEAMAMNLPIATFDVPAVAESVADTALRVPIGDVAALAAAMDRLLVDDELRSRLGRAARARFDANFDICVVATRMAQMYRETAEAAQSRHVAP